MSGIHTLCLVDNTASGSMLGEHGLAFWIETPDGCLLMDSGAGFILLHNVRRAGVDLSQAKAIVISHGHYDHTGGLGFVFEQNASASVVAHPDAFKPKYSKSGGGARSVLWRQIQADVTGHAHSIINVDEGPAYGAALLAGVGAGVWESVEAACTATIEVTDTCEVDPDAHELYGGYYALYRKLYAQLRECFEDVARLVE